jgi:hypothetical protein
MGNGSGIFSSVPIRARSDSGAPASWHGRSHFDEHRGCRNSKSRYAYNTGVSQSAALESCTGGAIYYIKSTAVPQRALAVAVGFAIIKQPHDGHEMRTLEGAPQNRAPAQLAPLPAVQLPNNGFCVIGFVLVRVRVRTT